MEVTTTVTGLQWDRLTALAPMALDLVGPPTLRLVHPSRTDTLSDSVHLRYTPEAAATLQEIIWDWMVANAAEAEGATVEHRRWLRNAAAAMSAANYRICTPAQVPVTVSVRAAWSVGGNRPPGIRRALTTAFIEVTDAKASVEWVTHHRMLVRAMETTPDPSVTLRRSSLAKPLPAGRGTKKMAVPEWWTLLAPTARRTALPAPGASPYGAAVRWYRLSATTARVSALSEISGPAGWALDWSVRFLARCCGGDTEAVREALFDVTAEGDPFDGAPVSPLDLWADPALTHHLVPRDEAVPMSPSERKRAHVERRRIDPDPSNE